MSRYAHLAFTPDVRARQQDNGSGRAYAKHLATPVDEVDEIGPGEAEFLTTRDGFYLASVSETGWPYVQYRGGPPGFVHVLDRQRFAFADVRGNRQYITTGNLVGDDRIAGFFMDYPTRTRLKVFGRAAAHEADDLDVTGQELMGQLSAQRTDGHVERMLVVTVEGVNWNCRQHITPRYSEEELAPTLDRLSTLKRENNLLTRENEALRAALEGGLRRGAS